MASRAKIQGADAPANIQLLDARKIARLTALCRAGIGCAFVAAPELAMRPWVGREAERPRSRLLVRALGARDLLIGAGTIAASEAESRRSWLAAGLIADLADLVLTLAGREHLPRRGAAFVALVAGGGVALGAAALAEPPARG